jgi:23S rRNA pseudouridine1911/1915/1917 synthase
MKSLAFEVESQYHGKRVDQFLALKLTGQASRSEIGRCIESRQVKLNGKVIAKKRLILNKGDKLQLQIKSKEAPQAVSLPLDILYEDDHLLVINKESGLVIHPAPGHWQDTLVNALLGTGKKLSDLSGRERPGVVHRLDKETSGVLVIAKDNTTHQRLSKKFEERSIQKTYWALVEGKVEFDAGEIEEPIGRHPQHPLKMAVRRDRLGKEALTRYRVKKRLRSSTLLEVMPLTGRTHQIRVHLAHLGHPVLGDFMYGRGDLAPRMALHAAKISFEHPETGKPLTVEAPLPEDLVALV